ncbi:hypothetical protein F5876DRAFT_65641 [Lentinula aff. lateritia]|uniref:Uncharacterized protein n=1 Tax=Lentinula aff. lateritia TaxID=2804960 RepID=A0ACC1U035_9AGAR|nr:hypothetical protein F5876DRAFT_65641 [Lentinula aff. lateritia]
MLAISIAFHPKPQTNVTRKVSEIDPGLLGGCSMTRSIDIKDERCRYVYTRGVESDSGLVGSTQERGIVGFKRVEMGEDLRMVPWRLYVNSVEPQVFSQGRRWDANASVYFSFISRHKAKIVVEKPRDKVICIYINGGGGGGGRVVVAMAAAGVVVGVVVLASHRPDPPIPLPSYHHPLQRLLRLSLVSGHLGSIQLSHH